MAASLGTVGLFGADVSSGIQPGATRQQVIDVYGPPVGRAKAGAREILHYRNGSVTLAGGRVERVSMKSASEPVASAPVNPPAASAGAPVAAKEPKSPMADVWMTSFEEAQRDATRRNAAILALFTTSDASPAARQFQKEIALHPEFVNAFRGRHVLLHIDAPLRTELPAATVQENEALRDRYAVRKYPTLLILSATGEKIAEIEIADAAPSNAFRGRLLAAVSAALPAPEPVVPPAAAPTPTPPPPAASSQIMLAPVEVTTGLSTARSLIAAALIVGTLVAGALLFGLWILLRKFNKPVVLNRRATIASRIDQAASGLPTPAEIIAWPKEAIVHLIVRLAEREGFVAEEQRRGGDKDLILKRPGNPAPELIVCCVAGHAGVIATRRIREMVGMLAAEEVSAGWYVAPTGFSLDARSYAEQHNVRLIDGAALIDQLSDLPSFALPKVLASAR